MLNFWVFNSRSKIVNQDGTATQSFYDFCRQVWNSLGGSNDNDLADLVAANTAAINEEVVKRGDADNDLQNQINGKQDKLNTAQMAAVNSGITSADVALIATALQSGDNVSELANDAGYQTAADVATAISTKADTDLGNLTASGKATGAALALPSTTSEAITIGASGTVYTAPKNGWIFITGAANTYNPSILLVVVARGNVIYQSRYITDGSVTDVRPTYLLVPMRAGYKVQINYAGLSSIKGAFIYCEGEV